jgi:hypothetical protein
MPGAMMREDMSEAIPGDVNYLCSFDDFEDENTFKPYEGEDVLGEEYFIQVDDIDMKNPSNQLSRD